MADLTPVERAMATVNELRGELVKAEAEAQDRFQDGVKAGLEQAAKLLDVSRSAILLAAGEMTAQEMRSVKAVLAWRQRVIRGS